MTIFEIFLTLYVIIGFGFFLLTAYALSIDYATHSEIWKPFFYGILWPLGIVVRLIRGTI